MTRDEALDEVRRAMAELFALDAGGITATSRLREDLGLDSVDGADLAARLQGPGGRRFDERSLRAAKTAGDVAALLEASRGG